MSKSIVYGVVNPIWKKPQCIVHNSSHDLCLGRTFCCFLYHAELYFCPYACVIINSPGVVKVHLSLWFNHPEIPTLSNIPIEGSSIDKAYFRVSVSETCCYRVVIFRDSSREQTIESVTRNTVVKEKKNTRGCPKDLISYWKAEWDPKWNKGWRSVSVLDTLQYLVVGPSGCGKICFTESLLLDHLEKLFVRPSPVIHYCYGVW